MIIHHNIRCCIERCGREFDKSREKVVLLIRDVVIGIEPLI